MRNVKQRRSENTVRLELEIVPDSPDGPYIACLVPQIAISSYIHVFESIVTESVTELQKSREKRDGSGYHITVVRPGEFGKMEAQFLDARYTECAFDIEVVGVGNVQRMEDTAFFLVCESDSLQAYRTENGLAPHDFHITLGFQTNDIHDVAKDRTTLLCSFV